MINNKMIEVKQDLDSIGYDTGIEIKIIPENFDATENFSKITSSQLDFIMMGESSINKENILMAFLYINSYIYIRPKKNGNEETMYNPETRPEAFWKSIQSMAKDLSMSKDTLNQCLSYLTSKVDDRQPLLIKKEVGSIQPAPSQPPQNTPNIYLLNKEGYEQEIEWAIHKMLQIYNVESFGELTGNYKD